MTNIVFACVVLFFVKDAISDTDILSKFHQHEFKIKDVRLDLMSYDPNIFNFYVIKAFKYNRTMTVHNVTWNFKVGVKDDLEVIVQIYKFLSNEYREVSVRFQLNVRKAVDANAYGLKQSLKCGNVTSFYFYKEITYHICNLFLDETHFPPLLPSGIYKAVAQLTYLDKEVAVVAAYLEIYTPIAYPKN